MWAALGANTISSQKKITPKIGRLWSGQFHFIVSRNCEIDYLKGRTGGFVTAISTANTREAFIEKAMASLRYRQLFPDDEYEQVENISSKYQDSTLSDEWMRMCDTALGTDEVTFNTFDLYMEGRA